MANQATSQAAPSSPTSPPAKRLRESLPEDTADAPKSPQQAAEAHQSGADEEATASPTSPLEEDDDVVEADNDIDNDSAFDSASQTSDSTSIATSMYAGHMENGRRYQTKREGEYWGPSDEKQWESLHAAHILCLVLESQQKNELFRSPITENPQNILDIGTGGGIWATEVADRFPSAIVHAVDLYPPPQTWVPPNCRFEVDDVLKPWMHTVKMDLIHMRLMLGSFTDSQWKGVYKQAYENLAPGGWIEQFEAGAKVYCDDGTLPADSTFAKWGDVLEPAFALSGRPIDTVDKMRGRIEDAGFINVHEKTWKVPVGEWAKHPLMKEAGKFNKMQTLMGMEGMCTFALTRWGQPTPWRPEEVQVWLAKIRNDINDPRIHSYNIWRRVWAQKPYDA